MGAFSTKKTLYGDTAKIPQVADQIRQAFVNEGYEVRIEDPASGQRIFIYRACQEAGKWIDEKYQEYKKKSS